MDQKFLSNRVFVAAASAAAGVLLTLGVQQAVTNKPKDALHVDGKVVALSDIDPDVLAELDITPAELERLRQTGRQLEISAEQLLAGTDKAQNQQARNDISDMGLKFAGSYVAFCNGFGERAQAGAVQDGFESIKDLLADVSRSSYIDNPDEGVTPVKVRDIMQGLLDKGVVLVAGSQMTYKQGSEQGVAAITPPGAMNPETKRAAQGNTIADLKNNPRFPLNAAWMHQLIELAEDLKDNRLANDKIHVLLMDLSGVRLSQIDPQDLNLGIGRLTINTGVPEPAAHCGVDLEHGPQ